MITNSATINITTYIIMKDTYKYIHNSNEFWDALKLFLLLKYCCTFLLTCLGIFNVTVNYNYN